MKKLLTSLCFALALISSARADSTTSYLASNQSVASGVGSHDTGLSEGAVGMGVMVGEPIGLTMKAWISSQFAIDYGLAYSLNDYVGFNTDFLYHFKPVSMNSTIRHSVLVPYAGVGLLVAASTAGSRTSNGGPFTPADPGSVGGEVRVPLGAELLLRQSSLGISAEIVPAFAFAPATNALLEGDIALRIYL